MDNLIRIKQDISKGDLGQAIKNLLGISLPLIFEEQIIAISARYQQLKIRNIKGLVSTEEFYLETNKINSSALTIVNELLDAGLDCNDNSSETDKKMSAEILQIAEKLFEEQENTKQPIESLQKNGKEILKNIEETINHIINDMEEKGVSYINQGKIMAIAENLNNLLEGKIEAGVIKNLSDSIYYAKNARGMVFKDVSKKEEAIFALQMAKGYLSALIEIS